ncbi:RNA polymerase II-associated protein 1-like [Ptychodera flava]|uniref:RNA polymerase II-associated protein 1-like n=1 Tax=Ptychodera flava TaxID=63121 RepID=UPI00396A47F6
MLDPKLVEFLTSRSKKAATTDVHTEVKTENPKQEIESGDTAMVTESPVEEAKQAQQEVKMPLEPKKEWVNMDTVEKEKMEWMQEVPKPKPGEKKIGIQARFDLQGHVISRDADVPMREGLHHHGEEPEAPGYTLEELFHLSRSAAMNQRVISLQTLAKVIYNYRIDNLGGRLGAPLIPRLIDAGLVFILRWSLDDSSEAGIAAAVDGFKSLLVQPADEECIDKVFPWYRGHEMHPLVPTENDDEDDEDDPEDKDDKNKHETELLEQDVIKGLLKMKFLERIRYILEVCRPAPTVVVNIIQVLTRIARHSPESCHEIMKCPRLMNTLFSAFLPTTWKLTDGSVMENIYGYPVRPVLKLIRVICSAGRNMAAILLTKYNLMSVIVRYTTQDPTDMQLQIGEAYMLSVEAFYTWKVCISYGLASNSISELYPVLMQHLQLFQRLSVLPRPASEGKSTQALYELQLMRSAAVVGLLEMAVHVGATVADLQSQQSMRPQEDEKKTESQPIPSIDWSHVTGLITPVELCCQRWMTEITRTDEPLTDCALTLATSCLNFIVAFYTKITQQPLYNAVDVLQHIEKLVENLLVPFMKSGNFYTYVINLRTYSSYKEDESVMSMKTGCKSLPDLRCHPLDERQHPCIQEHSPFGFMAAYIRLVYIWSKMHKGIAAKFSALIESCYVTSYLEKTCQSMRSAGETLNRHFSRFEHIVLYYIVKFTSKWPSRQKVVTSTLNCTTVLR